MPFWCVTSGSTSTPVAQSLDVAWPASRGGNSPTVPLSPLSLLLPLHTESTEAFLGGRRLRTRPLRPGNRDAAFLEESCAEVCSLHPMNFTHLTWMVQRS